MLTMAVSLRYSSGVSPLDAGDEATDDRAGEEDAATVAATEGASKEDATSEGAGEGTRVADALRDVEPTVSEGNSSFTRASVIACNDKEESEEACMAALRDC